MSAGRYATVENAIQAQKMGVDLIVLTGNPGNGVSNPAIISSLKAISEAVGEKIMLQPGKCMPPVSSAKAARTSSRKKISASLQRQEPISFCCRHREPCLASRPNMCGTDQLCTQPEKADDHIDRNFSGRCGHRYDQTHRTGVQDGRNRHPPHR